jgi:hypothetical protein
VTYHYWSLYLPTGERFQGRAQFTDRAAFLRQLDTFNAMQPGVWQYWSAN